MEVSKVLRQKLLGDNPRLQNIGGTMSPVPYRLTPMETECCEFIPLSQMVRSGPSGEKVYGDITSSVVVIRLRMLGTGCI